MKNGQSEEPRKGRRFCEKVDGPVIRRWYARMPTAELAERMGLTVRQIENFLNREKLEPGKVKDPKVRSAINSENGFSHWDRYLGMMTAMTQVPVLYISLLY